MPVRAVVFDFDGVLVDSEPAHAGAIEAALAGIGLAFPGKADYARYIGRGDRECLAEVALEQGRTLAPHEMDHLVRLKGEAFLASCRSGTIRPYPGSIAILRAASGHAPIAVCSGSQRESVIPVLESLGLMTHLTATVTASDVKRNKPSPDPYLLAAERLGLDPADCAAVEDSPTGIRSARGAGYTVHALCHSFKADALREAHHIHACCTALTIADLLGDAESIRRR